MSRLRTFGPSNRTWWFLPAALVLWPLVARNYRLRRLGILPDRWYWADALLFRHGYAVEMDP